MTEFTDIEHEQMNYSLTRRVDNYFIIKKKLKEKANFWDGEIKFIDRYNRIPVGLIKEVLNICKKYMFQVSIEGLDELYKSNYNEEDFYEWIDNYFTKEEFKPRDYQIEAAHRIFRYKNCTEEISTSGGKTLIAFMVFKYLYDNCNDVVCASTGIKSKKNFKMLYIVPNISLVTQTEEKFYEYEAKTGHKPTWYSECLYSGAEKSENNSNIVIGTFQSLGKKDLDYFKSFNVVIVDEAQHGKSNTIKNILIKCCNAEYKIGLTGTLPKEGSCDSFIIQSYIGPCVYKLEAAKLISDGNATPVKVIGIEMDYLGNEEKKKLFELRNVKSDEKDGAKLLILEKNIARMSRKRFIYICETIAKSTKNSLVLFSDIQNEYGRRIYDWLRENTNKNVYYIDGNTKTENRDYFKKKMEEEENTIIVASVGVFGEGIDIRNLHNIYICESHKSEIIIAQILGRGMRLLEGKDEITVIDFRDNFSWSSGYQRDNYLMRHAKQRDEIYRKRKFPFKNFKVTL